MALRRVLPSRATPDKAPDSAAVAENTTKNLAVTTSAPQEIPATPRLAGAAQETPAIAEAGAFAAAATSAFSTLPTAPQPASVPARVLEDSFTKPAAILETEAEKPSASAPALTSVAAPAPEPEYFAPAWAAEAAAKEASTPAVEIPVPAPLVEAVPQPAKIETLALAPEPEFVAPAWAAEAKPEIKPEPTSQPVQTAIVTPEPFVPSIPQSTTPATQPAPQASPAAPAAAVGQPFDFQPSRPDNSPHKRRVREKRPRDFTAMGAPENQAPERPKPTTSFAANVPVNTKPLDRVDEDLIAGGIIAPPPSDSLTGSLPTSMAEMTFIPAAAPEPLVIPVAAPQLAEPVVVPAPAVAPAPLPAPRQAPSPLPVPLPSTGVTQPSAERPPQAFAPVPVPAPAPAQPASPANMAPAADDVPYPDEQSPQEALEPLPPLLTPAARAAGAHAPDDNTEEEDLASSSPVQETPIINPAFSLSTARTTTPMTASTPLPPPQSDLPWTQTQASADWEIETPDNTNWGHETGHDAATAAPAAAHMPTPGADLYKPLGATTSPVSSAPSMGLASAPRMPTNFTPELPGQQRRKSGGTPWALIAVGVLAVAGGAAYVMHSGGTGHVQQQLASLTGGGSTPQAVSATTGGLLPPPETASFGVLSPPSAATSTDTSNSAVVNFADVPPDQANQPIVATGKEEMPKEMGLFAQLQSEVDKARARKEAGLPVDASVTTVAKPSDSAAAGATYTPEKLQEELAAYRSALAQSANPTELKPAAFRRDPDGYMDGKSAVTATAGSPVTPSGTDGQLAAGALLPPPAAASANPMPPAELYTNNPKHLPVVAEPLANAPERVRTLADFPDIQPYAPEQEKVEIPKGLKPKLAATDFPSLEVLSFVPGKGIVAFADGREGVLLIGESLNGWELVSVAPDHAEFKTGEKSYQVSADN